jgi:hypothetical protein
VTPDGVVEDELDEAADAPSVLARIPPATAPPAINATAIVAPRRAFGVPMMSSSPTTPSPGDVGETGSIGELIA